MKNVPNEGACLSVRSLSIIEEKKFHFNTNFDASETSLVPY